MQFSRPIGTLGCKHIASPIIMGISEPAYSEKELSDMAKRNAEGITYEGKHYTEYEATQFQRKLERAVRKTKRELIGADESGDKEMFTAKSIKLRRLREYYKDFSAKAGLPTQNERAQVAGFGRSLSGKAIWAEKNAYAAASPIFVNKNDKLYEYGKKIKPIKGYEDVVTHGDKIGFIFKDADGKESNVSVVEFANILRKSKLYHGGDIRLIACEAGADDSIVAQALADELGVNILAPSNFVFVDWDGNMTIGPDRFTNNGKWIIIHPKGAK